MADLNSIGGIHYEMMKRCYNKKSVMWNWYGEKGIGVCDEWHNREKFKKWATENGYQKGLRLERRDSKKDYSPENCYFGTSAKAKYGKNMELKKHIELNKRRKSELGLVNYGDSRLSHILGHMISRCHNPNDTKFSLYGGRGIEVCEEWRRKGGEGTYNFMRWAIDNGWKELDDTTVQTVDRINPNENYCPENCRFISLQEQQRNKRSTVKHEYNGEFLLLSEIARKEKVNYSRLWLLVNKRKNDIYTAMKMIRETN